jgi:two-component system, NarL family, nitrate/nitrite response regulator NarL
VFIADSDRLLREGLKVVLPKERFTIIGAADNLVHALAWFESSGAQVSLIICDPADNIQREFSAAATFTRDRGGTKIVVLTRRLENSWFAAALQSGISGFLSKDAPPEALVPALEVVLLGGQVFTPQRTTLKSASPLANGVRAPASDKGCALASTANGGAEPRREATEYGELGLSLREQEILNCLVAGLSNKMIARELRIAEATVKVHLKALLRKLNANNRTQAAVWAISRSAEPLHRETEPVLQLWRVEKSADFGG